MQDLHSANLKLVVAAQQLHNLGNFMSQEGQSGEGSEPAAPSVASPADEVANAASAEDSSATPTGANSTRAVPYGALGTGAITGAGAAESEEPENDAVESPAITQLPPGTADADGSISGGSASSGGRNNANRDSDGTTIAPGGASGGRTATEALPTGEVLVSTTSALEEM